MRRKKLKLWDRFQAARPEPGPAAAPSPGETERIRQQIANGDFGFAVDLAKQAHKRCRSAASEDLLIDAYGARIRSLIDRDLIRDARALLDFVRQNHPSRNGLCEIDDILRAREGGIEQLLPFWNDPALPDERRAAIEKAIQATATDLRAIATSAALAPDHPLRAAAAALVHAFEAVTSGPVEDALLALPEVPRNSPLAPWKLLVRAIAAFYRNAGELCDKQLAAIPNDAAVAGLAAALRGMMGGGQKLTPAAAALANKIGGRRELLRGALAELDRLFASRQHGAALQAIRHAVALCSEVDPGLLERLRQHISVCSFLADFRAEPVAAALGEPSLKNAYFWRLLARAYEERRERHALHFACAMWEEFRKHAVHERWFPAKGPETATLYLHMADLLQRAGDAPHEPAAIEFAARFQGLGSYYDGQPPEIRALMPAPGAPDLYFLYPGQLLERAAEAQPCSEIFSRRLEWVRRNQPAQADNVARHWRAELPRDVTPVLHLMRSAEARDALKRAFTYMAEAEELDALNPEVRNGRFRLLAAITLRHLRQKKARLAGGDLRDLEQLPQAHQGDRPAFLAALRWAWNMLSNQREEAERARAEIGRLLGGEAATTVVISSLMDACKWAPPKWLEDWRAGETPVIQQAGRACALGEDIGSSFEIPQNVATAIRKELAAGGPADPVTLLSLGDAALRSDNSELAYTISNAGLRHGSAEHYAGFLFLRARSLPRWETERRDDCIAAALQVARQRRNLDVLQRIGRYRDENPGPMGADDSVADPHEVQEVVEREKRERDYPRSVPRAAGRRCNCPAWRGELPREAAMLEQMVEEYGPEAVAQALADMIGLPSSPRKRKGGRYRGQDEFPF